MLTSLLLSVMLQAPLAQTPLPPALPEEDAEDEHWPDAPNEFLLPAAASVAGAAAVWLPTSLLSMAAFTAVPLATAAGLAYAASGGMVNNQYVGADWVFWGAARACMGASVFTGVAAMLGAGLIPWAAMGAAMLMDRQAPWRQHARVLLTYAFFLVPAGAAAVVLQVPWFLLMMGVGIMMDFFLFFGTGNFPSRQQMIPATAVMVLGFLSPAILLVPLASLAAGVAVAFAAAPLPSLE